MMPNYRASSIAGKPCSTPTEHPNPIHHKPGETIMGHKLEGRRARPNRLDSLGSPWAVVVSLSAAQVETLRFATKDEALAVTATRPDAINFVIFGPNFYAMTNGPLA